MRPVKSETSDPETAGAVLRTLLVSDLVGSTQLVEELGDQAAADLGRRHDRMARDLLAMHQGLEIDKTDGFLMLFERPLSAVLYSMDYHQGLKELSRAVGRQLNCRVGIHLGEVLLHENPPDDVARGAKPLEVEGLAKPMAARLMSLAGAAQTLLTRGAFDVARRGAVGAVAQESLRWLAHGSYGFKGVTEPVEVFEVGIEGRAPLHPPADSEKVRRVVEQDMITGWRPAPGLVIPHRTNWVADRRLGEGGFGEVWLGVHKKTQDRRVFKFCYDAGSLRSLQREITLFRLLKGELGERPDITRILDWSFEAAPYFIESEYRAGGHLGDWALEKGGLSQVALATRLEVVAQVATALAAAHSVGVLHKDVKPANVLIVEEGADDKSRIQAQLNDFGIGLVTEQERLAEAGITVLGLTESAEETTQSSFSGTRLYMAPEVLEGKTPTLRADIYSLGVMLYQMVVGDFTRVLAPGWRRDVNDELLCEDIAAAVDGSPDNRLADALRLAERLRNLESRRAERAARRREREEAEQWKAALEQARKRRWLMAAVIATLVVFGGAMTAMTLLVARQAERANREAEASQRVSSFLVQLFKVTDPFGFSDPGMPRGEAVTARQILDRGARRLETDLEDDPLIRARLLNTISDVYWSLGLPDAAMPLVEKALELNRRHLGEEHLEVATNLSNMARLRKADDDYSAAESLLRQALALRRSLVGEDHPLIATNLNNLAFVLQATGDYEEAESLFSEALAIYRRELGEEHPIVAVSLGNLAGLLQAGGDYGAAEPLYRKALAMTRHLLGEDHPNVATGLGNLASLLKAKGDYPGAQTLYQEALATYRRLLGEKHPLVTMALNNLAVLYHAKGNEREAEQLYRKILAIHLQVHGEEDDAQVATSMNNLASLLTTQGHYEEAEPLLREALAMRRRLFGAEHADVAVSLYNLARLMHARGDYEGAESVYRDALTMYRRVLGEEHPRVAESMNELARVLHARGENEAEPLFQGALAMRRRLLGEEHPDVAVSLSDLASLLADRGDYGAAEALIRPSLKIFHKVLPADHRRIRNAESVLETCLAEGGSAAPS